MPYQITHSHQDGVLHITASGPLNNPDNVALWETVDALAQEHQAKRILIECQATPGRVAMDHCFELIERLPVLSRKLACKIALFKQHAEEETRELLRFVETAATDRGAHLKIFFEIEEAKLWVRN